MDDIETCVDLLITGASDIMIVLAGDLNRLPEQELVTRTGLSSTVNQPTRGASCLDRIYVSECYTDVNVFKSDVNSDHIAVIAYTGATKVAFNKVNTHTTNITSNERIYVTPFLTFSSEAEEPTDVLAERMRQVRWPVESAASYINATVLTCDELARLTSNTCSKKSKR